MKSNGAQAAFITALERNRGILFKVAAGYCSDRAEREDLIQDMIVQLWRSYERFDGRSSFSTWMYRIALNVAILFYRHEQRQARHRADAGFLEEALGTQEPRDERISLLREMVEQLDEMNRALMLLYLDDLPHSEIATILGISETNVATKIGRIKQRLKRIATEAKE